MARGHGPLSFRLFFIYFVFLTVSLLEFTNNSFNTTEIAETFPKNRLNKLISGRKYRALGFDSSQRKKYFAIRTNYYPNSSSGFQQSRLILLSGNVEENPDMVNETRANSTHVNVKIGHLNICSLKNREHYILIRELVMENDFDIFTISETWLNKTVADVEVEFPGYTIHRLDREKKLGGGVCAYVKEGYKIDRLNELSSISDSGLHQMWLKIQAGNRKSFIVCTVYRPPDTTLNCFEDDLSETVISALAINKDIYILGDLNCNVLNTSDLGGQSLLNFCTAYNLTQVINEPTRITQSSQSLIDVILVSNKNVVKESKVLPVSISDHDLVYITINVKKTRPKPIYITTRSF